MESVHNTRNPLLISLGVVASLAGAAGSLLLAIMLTQLVPQILQSGASFFAPTVVFQVLWLVFSAALFVTGLSLLTSGWNDKRHDVVPGLTLYYLGASLFMIGLLLLTFGDLPFAAAACVGGAFIMWLEWYSDAI